MKKYIWLLLSGIIIMMFQNCAQNMQFTDLNEGLDLSSTEPTPPEWSEQFKVVFNQEAAPLDMMWVIDNSGSMSQEAAHVSANFSAFLTELNKSTNFKFAVVSDTGRYGVKLPSGFDSQTHKQSTVTTNSTNGPAKLLEELKGSLKDFFRASSKKIIVFVTDDNSAMASDKFLADLQTQQGWTKEDISVFGFVGLGKTLSPCQARDGTAYMDMSAATGGKTYNICESDWVPLFSDLIDVSVYKAARRFTLSKKTTMIEISSVQVDGVELSNSAYFLKGNILTLSDIVPLVENSMVRVDYK